MSSSDPSVDVTLLRNAIRLVHCLQKERGSSCAFYADNLSFEQSMMEARSVSDTSATLIRRNDVPVASQLSKIRDLITSHRNPQESDDEMALHRIFVCFNTLISYVVHEYILKEISAGTDRQPAKSTIRNRHRRGLSVDINDKLSSKFTLTPETEKHKTFPEPASARKRLGSRNESTKKLATLHSMDEEVDETECSNPPSPPPSMIPQIGQRLSSPSCKVSFHQEKAPKIEQILDLLHFFIQLKESAGVERAILSSLLAFRGTDDPSLRFLMNDLILEVENQRSLIGQLECLPEDDHRKLVLELSSLSPQLQELQMIILSDFESLKHAEYDAENIWDMITLYVDKLHSVELLLVEELECCLPISMSKVLLSGVLVSKPIPSARSLATSQQPAPIPEEKALIGLTLQQIFGTKNNNELTSNIEAMSPAQIKQRLLEVLETEEPAQRSGPSEETEKSNSGEGHHFSSAVSLKENMSRVLTKGAAMSNPAAKEWEISIYELKFTKRIGVGAAATTYLADWTGQQVAVKVASISRFGLEGWRTEVDALQRLHHPNIIRLLGSVYHEAPLTYCLVLEYCNAGDLSTVLKYPTPKNFFFTAALGIANAMAYLHSRNIIHRDLKPANILCDGNVASGHFTVKVTDFGVATDAGNCSTISGEREDPLGVRETRNLTGETGTYRWMAPEVIRHEPYTTNADVYSFAIMLWQFLTREDPFLDVSALEAAKLVAIEKQRPPIPSKTPNPVAELLQINWDDSPKIRWSFDRLSNELRKLHDTLNIPEKEFLESTHGHAVYEYDEPDLEAEKQVKEEAKGGKWGRDGKEAETGIKRASVLSNFFGHKKDRKKKGH